MIVSIQYTLQIFLTSYWYTYVNWLESIKERFLTGMNKIESKNAKFIGTNLEMKKN